MCVIKIRGCRVLGGCSGRCMVDVKVTHRQLERSVQFSRTFERTKKKNRKQEIVFSFPRRDVLVFQKKITVDRKNAQTPVFPLKKRIVGDNVSSNIRLVFN